MDTYKKELFLYQTSNGRVPFEEWLESLKDRKARAVIRTRLNRAEQGNAGEFGPVGSGVYELKVRFGPGYRVYFGEDGKTLIILLLGGDKSTQDKDIKRAIEYWEDYTIRK